MGTAAPAPAPKPPPKPAQPLISDDFMSQIGGAGDRPEPAKAAEPAAKLSLEKMEKTQMLPEGHDTTQKLPPDADRTHRMDAVKPESTQRMDAAKPDITVRLPAAKPPPEMTQPLGPGGPPKVPEKPAAFTGEQTIKIPKLDPNYRPPDSPPKADPSPNTTQPLESNK